MKSIDLVKLKEAADNFRTTLAAHRQNPRNYGALDAWDRASGEFIALVNNDELNIIAVLIDKLEIAEGERAGAFLACDRWHDKLRDAEKKLEAAQRERDELLSDNSTLRHCRAELSREANKLLQERDEAEAELKRRDAQEPAMHIYKGSEKHVWIECGKDYPRGRAVYFNASSPAAALPEKVVELPKPFKRHIDSGTFPQKIVEFDDVTESLDAAGVKWVEGE